MGFSRVRAGFLLAVLVFASLGGAPVLAQQATIVNPVIGVVDVDEIQQEALAAKAVRSQAAKYRQDFQQQGSSEESTLRTEQQAIEAQRKTLAQDALAEKARAFDAQVADYQRRELARRRAFEKSFNLAMANVQKVMNEAIGTVAMSHGVNVVLPKSLVLAFDDKLNMTKEVIAIMDKKLPSADFPAPQIENEPAANAAQTKTPPKKKN